MQSFFVQDKHCFNITVAYGTKEISLDSAVRSIESNAKKGGLSLQNPSLSYPDETLKFSSLKKD